MIRSSFIVARAFALGLFVSIAVCGGVRAAAAEDHESCWPQWRGPNMDGTVTDQAWPDSLGADVLKLRWRTPLGQSYSGPVIAGDRVYVTEDIENKEEGALALDRATGEILWRAHWPKTIEVAAMGRNQGTWMKATPAWDDGRLYVAGMADTLTCLDAKTGEEIWRVDFAEQYGTKIPSFGAVTSPIVFGDGVFVQAARSFIKLDKLTGETAWRVLEQVKEDSHAAFTSPTFQTIAGRAQFVVHGPELMAGIDPNSGDILWSFEIVAVVDSGIVSPTVFGNNILSSTGHERTFALNISNPEGGYLPTKLWKNKSFAYMSTPVIVDGHAYMHMRNQRPTCINLETGETTWTDRDRYGRFASMVTNGEKILILSAKGKLGLLRANPEKYDKLSGRQITEADTWAQLAVCDGEMFIREVDAMTLYDWGD